MKKWRYAYVFLNWNVIDEKSYLSVFVSPDKQKPNIDVDTPYEYITSRNEISYLITSQVQLTRENAVLISRMLYEEEFSLKAVNRRKKMVAVNR